MLYGVVGDPISHSLSPLIHRSWIRAHGRAAEYLAFQVPAGELSAALETLDRRGAKGLNITLPHKTDALALAESATTEAAAIGASNTLIQTPTGWRADNTDAPGFSKDLKRHTGDISGAKIALIGAGGAARAVAFAVRESGACVTIANRTPERAQTLLERFEYSPDSSAAVGLGDLGSALESCDIVVNATSAGHAGQGFEWPLGRGRLVYDLSYGKAAEAVLIPAQSAGWRTADGLGMLVAQAALSFKTWFGIAPDEEAALSLCRSALEAA
ncbi:MAG: shikimate dehydrogenase [Pseudomonadota bacterium]